MPVGDGDRWASDIAAYEVRTLDGATPPAFDHAVLVASLVRVRAAAAFWRRDGFHGFPRRAAELAIGAHAYRRGRFVFVVTGTPRTIEVYYALESPDTVAPLLRAAYPGVEIEPVARPALAGVQGIIAARLIHSGKLTGVPTAREERDDSSPPQRDETGHLERVVRGMRDAEWAYVVSAQSYERHDGNGNGPVHQRAKILERLAAVASSVREQRQLGVTERDRLSEARDLTTRTATTQLGREVVDWNAQYLVGLLEQQLKRIDEMLAVGHWGVTVDFGATTPEASERLGTLLSSVFSGDRSRPQPVRTALRTRSGPPGPGLGGFVTVLNSRELGLLIQLPREESPGYAIRDHAPYDVDVSARPESGSLGIGKVLRDGAYRDDYEVAIAPEDLTKHALVVGVTGSGKTTTIRRLLRLAATAVPGRPETPFLVIEPAKTEYRALLPSVDGVVRGALPELRIYTLGNESVAPFRLNPFEFDLGPTPGGATLLLPHIDLLKAVFNAAFILYAPMPYVLEIALHEVYEDKGWVLATGENVHLSAADWTRRDAYPIFPTLSDLSTKVDTVTRRLGYDGEIERNVIAGLTGRIASLRVGSKGTMLDVPRGVPMADLLGRPTVLELENIGNDAEKTFLMGLILGRLYEARRLQAATGTLPRGLQHLLVVEEAHRLLRRTDTDVGEESANARAQAVEAFVNILSEIRRYGQGVIVAEQIPQKLAPDAIKNTSLKVVHRLLAEDDRAALAATMNMTNEQSRRLTTLRPGQAAVSSEGDDHPYLVYVVDADSQASAGDRTDAEVAAYARRAGYINLGRCLPLVPADVTALDIPLTALGAPDMAVVARASRFAAAQTSAADWAEVILRAAYASSAVAPALRRLWGRLSATPGRLSPSGGRDRERDTFRLALALGASSLLHARMGEHDWTYAEVSDLQRALALGLVDTAEGRVGNSLSGFSAGYRRLLGRAPALGPYTGCAACPAPCHYRSDVARLLTPALMGDIDISLGDTERDWEERLMAVEDHVHTWLGSSGPVIGAAVVPGIAYCCALITIDEIRLPNERAAVVAGLGEATRDRMRKG